MKIIPMNYQGQTPEIMVDDEDYPFLSRFTWQQCGGGYAGVKWPTPTKGSFILLYIHKLIMATHGLVDHINGNKLDCRKENLRVATYRENGWNTRKRMVTCTGKPPSSLYKGVSRCIAADGRVYWRVIIKLSKKGEVPPQFARLGPFDTEIEAALAYNEEIVKHRGEWAVLNDIQHAAA